LVLPPEPPITKKGGGRPSCEHDRVKFKKISKTAVEGFCAKCNETLGIIIVDPNPARINAYMQVHVEREPIIAGKPTKLSYKERLKLK
jgi:hypothetical protein